MGKKKFIDKKAPGTHSFALVHRSQRDPLAADPEAPQLVLQPNDGDALVSIPPRRRSNELFMCQSDTAARFGTHAVLFLSPCHAYAGGEDPTTQAGSRA